jgi:alpha-tubulin suppressor-like RCC1 family protein
MSCSSSRRIFARTRPALSPLILLFCTSSCGDSRDAGIRFTSIAAGYEHTCGTAETGAAYCWGSGFFGQLGIGASESSGRPITVSADLPFVSVTAAERHSCGLTENHVAVCWGYGMSGQLGVDVDPGIRPHTFANPPVEVSGNLEFVALDAGRETTCGITRIGSGYCWGDNSSRAIGNDSVPGFFPVFEPVRITGDLEFVSLSTSGRHSCGTTRNGVIYCWGANERGQLGDGSTEDRVEPVAVASPLKFNMVSASERFTCGLTDAGRVYCWGANWVGELGNGSLDESSVPVPVLGDIIFTSVSSGYWHVCAVSADGRGYCWGSHRCGQLGVGNAELETCGEAGTFTESPCATSPVPVAGNLRFGSISAGGVHTCGVTTGGLGYCWGSNDQGRLGNGTTSASDVPVRVSGAEHQGIFLGTS